MSQSVGFDGEEAEVKEDNNATENKSRKIIANEDKYNNNSIISINQNNSAENSNNSNLENKESTAKRDIYDNNNIPDDKKSLIDDRKVEKNSSKKDQNKHQISTTNSFPMLATPGGLLLRPNNSYSMNIPMESNAVRPKLQNIVCTVNLACKLLLKNIALNARNAEYNPKRFAAVIMRIKEPRTTALIFSSGRMVCTGAKSEVLAKLAAKKYARIIQKLGFDVKFKDFKIQNMVGSCDVGFPIRLEGLVLTHGQFCSYEPELFPGLIYRMVKPKIVLLVFVSGKVVLTGAKQRSEIEEAYDAISPILRGFRKH